jgi:hypothetical protein
MKQLHHLVETAPVRNHTIPLSDLPDSQGLVSRTEDGQWRYQFVTFWIIARGVLVGREELLQSSTETSSKAIGGKGHEGCVRGKVKTVQSSDRDFGFSYFPMSLSMTWPCSITHPSTKTRRLKVEMFDCIRQEPLNHGRGRRFGEGEITSEETSVPTKESSTHRF